MADKQTTSRDRSGSVVSIHSARPAQDNLSAVNVDAQQTQSSDAPADPSSNPTNEGPHAPNAAPSTPAAQLSACSPGGQSLSKVRTTQPLEEIVQCLPTFDQYGADAAGNPTQFKGIWSETKGKQRLSWGERETRIMLACILKAESSLSENIVELKQKKIRKTTVKSVDNGISKTVCTFIAWNLRKCGNSLFKSIDIIQVKNHWAKVRSCESIGTLVLQLMTTVF